MPLLSDPSVGIAEPLLRRAYLLAEEGRGTVSPNPLVGCVIARDGMVVGQGHHERAGGPHAEVVALRAAGERARGADVVVTLEPCNHYGRTPPCTDALIAAGVRSVTIGMPDPNVMVSGGGAAALQAAGIRVAWASDPELFRRQNETWLHRLRTGRPFVRVKLGVTLDGHASLEPGERSAITGRGGRSITMRLRSEATAVAVGANTVRIDDPLLTVRSDEGDVELVPRRYVLARKTVPPDAARLFADTAHPTTVLIGDTADEETGARGDLHVGVGRRIVRYPAGGGLGAALERMAADGVDDVLVECGPQLFEALVDARLIDELVIVTAGGLAGAGAPALYDGVPTRSGTRLSPEFVPVEVGIVENDVVTVWRPTGVAPRERREERASECSQD